MNFTGNVISVKEKASRYGNGTYVGVVAKSPRGSKVWFAGGADLLQILCDDAQIEVEFEDATTSDDGGIEFLKRARVVSVDGAPIAQPKPKAQAPRASVENLKPVVDLLAGVQERNKRRKTPPSFSTEVNGQVVELKLLGSRSATPGHVKVTDGRPYGSNKYFGKIDPAGNFTGSRETTPEIVAFLRELGADPVKAAQDHAHRTKLAEIERLVAQGVEREKAEERAHGTCMFCAADLTDQRSIDKSYGPICASNYGLPWGD